MENKKVLEELKLEYGEYLDLDKKIPKPYYEDLKKVRAILLGSSPMLTKYTVDYTEQPEYVFNLSEYKEGVEGEDIFGNINSNLLAIDLNLDEIYAENLCKNHLKNISVHDDAWVRIAHIWGKDLKKELDELFSKEIPVLVTATWMLKALGKGIRDGMHYYTSNEFIKAEDNILDRVLIPFFRHEQYDLNKDSFKTYSEKIKEHIN